MQSNKNIQAHKWVNEYADYLFHYAHQRVDDVALSNDLIQDTFLSALEGMDKFEGRSSELTWLRAILKNKIIDHYRKQASGLNKIMINMPGKQEEALDFFDENGIWKEAFAPKPFAEQADEKLQAKEFYEILKMCMKKLPKLWASVFSLKHIDEEDSSVICEQMNITNANYWVIIHRAKLNLRECFQNNW
ncbi:RNA polymerase sigma-70 factor, ECF subfamily [Chitinophaga costaii]|uniref:RNA polymerase sigma-70 factor, ECF subfamily n=1 Tax=Chitinophaga costaii TaxID=1335309 RepID=A0A1C4EL78_9BACT|nr:sigma-70 family RNA polymerase sigma factor [Chitinophaga costaii]PUZ22422.1 RNA polymerase subunit sigma-24 [Chitinophaga costaii]SCC44333.1 RNA polymerase sigma-70 factor, ECF subfamily [Chitinophaga costaii]